MKRVIYLRAIKRKLQLKAIKIILPIFLVLFLPSMLIFIILGGSSNNLIPQIDDEQQQEFKIVAANCGIDWEEFLAYITVAYENNFQELDPEDLALEFLIVRADRYEEVEKQIVVIVIENGKKVKRNKTVTSWELINRKFFETKDQILSFAKETGCDDEEATKVVKHLKELSSGKKYEVTINSKEMMDIIDSLSEDQQEWYNALISQNILKVICGSYYELPDEIIVQTAGYFAYPLPGHTTITSPFGWRSDPFSGLRSYHKGLDVAANIGTPIIAAADGVVISTSYKNTGYGYSILIKHVDDDGEVWHTRYAHLSQIQVRPDQEVTRGKVIGAVGNTGRSTGAHLHFEIRYNTSVVDPLKFVKPQ